MIEPKDKILVGVSGGADSVCLLFLLYKLSVVMDFEVFAVHVNHQIRETAPRDEAFVKELCERFNVSCFVESVPVLEIAKKQGISVEEAGRQVRFDAFAKYKKALRADKIALAHHKDDQAETVLFHLCRGCGVDGIQGIKPVRQDVIHPLLCVDRREIEDYLAKEKLTFVTDETNLLTEYSRNVLRHEVLPVLEERICKGSSAHIARTADISREAVDYLNRQTMQVFERTVSVEQEGFLVNEMLFTEHAYIQKSVILEVLSKAAGSRKDISSVHIESVVSLFGSRTGSKINLPYGLMAEKGYEGIRIIKVKSISANHEECYEQLILDADTNSGEYNFPDGTKLLLRVFEAEENMEVPQKTYTKWFDYDKIKKSLVLRTRQTGDYIYVAEGQRQTVKAYMINAKIPAAFRNEIPMIADGNHVLWMIGHRISSFYKITNQTKRVLEVEIPGGNEDGRENTCNDI